jgi:voltage-gated potassium channel
MFKKLLAFFNHFLHTAFNNPVRNVQLSLATLALVIVLATLVYMGLEQMDFVDALYMTVITITTVGFGEIVPLSPGGRIFTMLLIILGVGLTTTAISNAVSIILGPRLWISIRERNLERRLMKIEDHYVVCGYGRVGKQVVEDLEARGEAFVLLDVDPDLEQEMIERSILHIIGDATNDDILLKAGIERARGLVAALESDAENIMTVLTARELNPHLFIVARVSSSEAEKKLRRAGANRVVSPYQIGGHRVALALLRPAVNDFLDRIFRFRDGLDMDIGQVLVNSTSRLSGQTVSTCELRQTHNVSILAIQKPKGTIMISPNPNDILEEGSVLIVIGPSQSIYELEKEYRVTR